MRRTLLTVVATAIVTSVVTSVTVSAASGGRGPAPSDDGERTASDARLPVIVDTKVDCGVPQPGQDWPNQDALENTIRCLENEVINVNRFMKAFFRCARINEVTRYGSADGSSGYEFVDTGAPFLKPALDFTGDPATEPFHYFMLWQDSNFCLS